MNSRIGFLSSLIILVSLVSGCAKTVQVEPGQELVMIDKPYIFGHEGVREKPLTEGRKWLWSSTDTVAVSVVPHKFDEPFDDLSTSNNNFIDYSSYLSLKVIDSVKLIDKFGLNWYDNNLKQQYGTIVRVATRKYQFDDILSNPATSQKIEDEVRKELDKIIKQVDLPIIVVDMSLGRARPNAPVKAEMDATAAQQQRKKTLVAAENAENQRLQSEKARAKADNAYRESMNMDAEQFVRLQTVKEYAAACRVSGTSCYIFTDKVPVVAK